MKASIAEVSGKLVLGPTKTGNRRTVVLSRALAQMLGEHIGRFPSKEGYVFTAKEGGPLRRKWYIRSFKPAVKRAGIKDIRSTISGTPPPRSWPSEVTP